MIKTDINISFDPKKEPKENVSYFLKYENAPENVKLKNVPDDALYSAGKSIQAIFNLFEAELISRKSSYQLRTRKERRGIRNKL